MREGSRWRSTLRAGRSRVAGVAGEEGRLGREAADGARQGPKGFRAEDEVKVALYARVSTHEQTAENQLLELRVYVAARGWSAVEYVDEGVSGAKDRRPALDQLVSDVHRHKVQAVVC